MQMLLLIFAAFLWHLLQLHFQLHSMRWAASLSGLELCSRFHGLRSSVLNKQTTFLLTYHCLIKTTGQGNRPWRWLSSYWAVPGRSAFLGFPTSLYSYHCKHTNTAQTLVSRKLEFYFITDCNFTHLTTYNVTTAAAAVDALTLFWDFSAI